jgi:hypothetical protein
MLIKFVGGQMARGLKYMEDKEKEKRRPKRSAIVWPEWGIGTVCILSAILGAGLLRVAGFLTRHSKGTEATALGFSMLFHNANIFSRLSLWLLLDQQEGKQREIQWAQKGMHQQRAGQHILCLPPPPPPHKKK